MAKVIDLETGKKLSNSSTKPQIRATMKQRRAVRALLENPSLSAGKALERAGYAATTVSNPAQVTKSEGFVALMDSIGLTDQYLGDKLHEDIEGKPKNRLGELTLAYKLKGRLKESETGNTFTPATINIAVINNTDNGSVKP